MLTFLPRGDPSQTTTAGFDTYKVHHRVKLLRDDGDAMLVENHDGVACLARGDDFSRLFISDRTAHSFDMDTSTRFRVWRDGDRLLVVTHR